MKHYMIHTSELRRHIEYDKEVDELLDDHGDLVDVFQCKCNTTAVVIIPTMYFGYYDTHPDGLLGITTKRITLNIPIPDWHDFLAVQDVKKSAKQDVVDPFEAE